MDVVEPVDAGTPGAPPPPPGMAPVGRPAASTDAIRAFLQGNLDYLAIGDFLVEHPGHRQ